MSDGYGSTLAIAAATTVVALWGAVGSGPSRAAEHEETDAGGVYIIFDGSGSMWGQLPDQVHKITAARDVLTEFVASDFGDRELALRAYGHNRKGDCSDTVLEVPFAPAAESVSKIQAVVGKINPKGKTPISRSLRAALDDFDGRNGEIILISDGIETCDEDPCELVRKWMEEDVQIKVHVVGLGLQGKEKAAMQCISEAAGTEYQDASTAAELAEGLASIRESSSTIALKIRATDEAGEEMTVKGWATPPGGERVEVKSHFRNVIPAGAYSVEVGVETRNGTIYKPVTANVTVRERGETVLEVVVERPPTVRATFLEDGEKTRGSHVTAYQGDEEVFSFRAKDQVFAEPGTYEFRAQPNDYNDLSLEATLAEGEDEELIFELQTTVRAIFTLVASGSGTVFRHNFELWQNGELVSKVHRVNGVLALPGTYDLRLPNPITPYVRKNIVLTEEDRQEFTIEVPAGHVTVIYQEADGTRQKDDYINIYRWTGEKWDQSGKVRRSGTRIPLTEGRYQLEGFSRKGVFDPIEFEIVDGDEKEFVLRDGG